MDQNLDKFNLGILTISDTGSKGERKDASGDTIYRIMDSEKWSLVLRDILPDEPELVSNRLREWCDEGEVDVILTTGGTGLGPRDITPEALQLNGSQALPVPNSQEKDT